MSAIRIQEITSFNAGVIAATLTGYASTTGSISASDSLLTAIQKLNGNIGLVSGAVVYQGTWNASTNTPTLTSSTGTKGYMYKVSVAGATTLDGISQWNVGDSAVFDGTVWDKIDGIASEVISVFGRTGAVVATANDYTFAQLASKPTTISGYAITDTVAQVLTGYASTTGTITAGDTIVGAISKLNGNIAALTSGVSSVFGRTGAVVAVANDYTFGQLASKPTTISGYGITDTVSQVLTGYSSTTGVLSTADTIVGGISKLNGNIGALVTGVSSVYGRVGAVVAASGDYTFAQISGKPTTVSGYGITDVYTQTTSDARYVALGGSIMTGFLTLSADPSSSLHAATKNYVDNVITGIVWASAGVATTASITLSGEQTIDGITTSASIVLVKNQATGSQNGLYTSAAGAWTRTSDASTGPQVTKLAVIVTAGTTQGNTQWIQTGGTITLGTTSVVFTEIAGQGTYTNGTGISLSANVFSLNTTYTNTLYPQLAVGYVNPSWITSLPWSKITATPTTISGYGITDTVSQVLTGYSSVSGTVSAATTIVSAISILNGNAALLAPIASPTFTGVPAAPTPGTNINTTQIPTTAWVNSYYVAKTSHVAREIPTGAINGSNTTFTIAHVPATTTDQVFLNGLLQNITSDYTLSGTTITMIPAPFTGDSLVVSYVY
jgi:hypothetical protein